MLGSRYFAVLIAFGSNPAQCRLSVHRDINWAHEVSHGRLHRAKALFDRVQFVRHRLVAYRVRPYIYSVADALVRPRGHAHHFVSDV